MTRRLEALLDGLLARKEIHSAVMSVVSGDGALRWAGARGAMSPDGTPMTPTTPWFIASITKLFVASMVLRISLSRRHFRTTQERHHRVFKLRSISGLERFR